MFSEQLLYARHCWALEHHHKIGSPVLAQNSPVGRQTSKQETTTLPKGGGGTRGMNSGSGGEKLKECFLKEMLPSQANTWEVKQQESCFKAFVQKP